MKITELQCVSKEYILSKKKNASDKDFIQGSYKRVPRMQSQPNSTGRRGYKSWDELVNKYWKTIGRKLRDNVKHIELVPTFQIFFSLGLDHLC